MTNETTEHLSLAELMALDSSVRATEPTRPDVLQGAFAEQRAYILDPAPLKASFCTRRAAKSFSVGLEYVNDAFDYPRAHYLFLMTVRAQAERDFWNDVLKAIDRQYNVGMKFNETKLIATLPNGAMIYVGGADSSADEWRKLLAGKYRKVHVDEAQGFIHADLSTLVYEAFKPAVADYRGSIGISGTPGIVAKGLFYDVTQGRESGWSLHRWKTSDNPYMAEKIAAEIEELKRLKPGVEDTPWFRRNYKGEWVIEDSALVYRYSAERNTYVSLPEYKKGQWHYVLGCDLGHTDATAWVVCCYHDFDRTLYVVSVTKESGLDITAVARRTDALRRTYDFDVLVIDGANKQAVEEMVNRHRIPWQAADKTGKADFIEIMNADLLAGAIKLGAEAKPLAEEYAALVWDEKKLKATGERKEHAACDNHAADAALYAWRYCYQYMSEKSPPPEPTKDDEIEAAAESRYRTERDALSSDPAVINDSSNWEAGWQWQ